MLLVDTVDPKGYRTLMTPSAVKFAATDGGADNYNPTRCADSPVSVGLIEGPVEINQNVETTPHTSDILYNPYDLQITGLAWQVTFSMDQVDVYNLALQISFAQGSISGQSVVQLRGREYFSGLKCMEIETDGSRVSATTGLITQKWQFYKVKVVSNGAITMGRETQTRLPVMVHCLANDDDIVGQVTYSSAYGSAPGYES